VNIFRYRGMWNCTCVSHGGRFPKWLPCNVVLFKTLRCQSIKCN